MAEHVYGNDPGEQARYLRDQAWNIHAAAGDYDAALATLDAAFTATDEVDQAQARYFELKAGHSFVAGRVKLAKYLRSAEDTEPLGALQFFHRATIQFDRARHLRSDQRPSQVELHMAPHRITAEALASQLTHPVREIGKLLVMSARSESPKAFAPETVNQEVKGIGLVRERSKRLAYAGLTAVVVGLSRYDRREAARSVAKRYVLPDPRSARRMPAA